MRIQNLIECYNKLVTSRYKDVATPYYDVDAIYETDSQQIIPINLAEPVRYKAFKYDQPHIGKLVIAKLFKLTVDPFDNKYRIDEFKSGDTFKEPLIVAQTESNSYILPSCDIKMTLRLKSKKYVTN